MAAAITQDMIFNVVMNTASFIVGLENGLNSLDALDRGFTKIEKSVNFASQALATFTGMALLEGVKLLVRGLTSAARAVGNLVGKLGEALVETEEVGSRWANLGLIIREGIGGPLWDTIIGIASDALDRITALFRTESGQWTDAFYRLRAIVQTFAGWLTSLWERLMGKLGDAGETWLDRLIAGLIKAIQTAASLLRRFATFVARIFGGQAPAEVTEEAVSRVQAAPMARPAPVRALVGEEEVPKAPKAPRAARAITPVAPPRAEDLKQMSILTSAWADATKRLAAASAAAAKARAAMAKAEDWLERASERVYDIRRKLQQLEVTWAEVPERFVRGRRRALQLELQAAEHSEHERKKEADAARERFQAAETFRRETEQVTNALKRQIDTLAKSIERQAEAYEKYLVRLQESRKEQAAMGKEQEEAAKKTWDAFKGLEIPPELLREVQEQLQPAFADIEASVASLVDSLGIAWEKGKAFGRDFIADLKNIKGWLVDVAEKIIAMFNEIIAKVQELWGKVQPTIEKVRDLIPEERESQAARWMTTAEALRDARPEVEKAAKETFFDTITGVFEDLSDIIYRRSLVPDLVLNVVDWFTRMELDTTAVLDRLRGQIQLLEGAAQGLMPRLEDLNLASGGNFKLITVNLQGSKFGGDLTEWQVKDWMYDALRDVTR